MFDDKKRAHVFLAILNSVHPQSMPARSTSPSRSMSGRSTTRRFYLHISGLTRGNARVGAGLLFPPNLVLASLEQFVRERLGPSAKVSVAFDQHLPGYVATVSSSNAAVWSHFPDLSEGKTHALTVPQRYPDKRFLVVATELN